jgi:hypothetical protein
VFGFYIKQRALVYYLLRIEIIFKLYKGKKKYAKSKYEHGANLDDCIIISVRSTSEEKSGNANYKKL